MRTDRSRCGSQRSLTEDNDDEPIANATGDDQQKKVNVIEEEVQGIEVRRWQVRCHVHRRQGKVLHGHLKSEMNSPVLISDRLPLLLVPADRTMFDTTSFSC